MSLHATPTYVTNLLARGLFCLADEPTRGEVFLVEVDVGAAFTLGVPETDWLDTAIG